MDAATPSAVVPTSTPDDGAVAYFDLIRPLAALYARRPVSSVAAVGNAPLPPSEERAAAIDAADLVVRVNGFRLDAPGEPPAVGTRTDVVVFNRGVRATPWFFQDYQSRLYLMIEPGRFYWEREASPHWWPRDFGYLSVPNREVIVPLNLAMGIDPREKPEWATTGTTMAWIARHLFPDAALSVTGLSFIDQPDQTSWEHAYGDPCPVGPEHKITSEADLLRSWIESGRISYLP